MAEQEEKSHTAIANARMATLSLLEERSPDATVCPSEVARAVTVARDAEATKEAWRNAMPTVHASVDQLLAEGLVRLSWKGKTIAARAGPYRIHRHFR